MPELHFSNFSGKEDQLYRAFQVRKDHFLQPFCRILQKYHLHPDILSYGGLMMSLLFVICLPFSPWLALVALILNIFFDGLDGAYARFLKKNSAQGNLLDRAADYASFFVIFSGLLYYHIVNPFWGFLYFVSFTVMFFLTMTLNHLRIDFPYVLKTKYLIYLLVLVWMSGGANIFDPALVFFSIYTIVINLFLLHRLRCSLS